MSNYFQLLESAPDRWKALQQDHARLRAQVAALVAVVEAVEWDAANECPWCHLDEHSGHATDCALAAALALVQEGE